MLAYPRRDPRTSVSAILLLVLLTSTFSRDATATVFWPVALKSCVGAAAFAFAGTVTEMRPERVPGNIVTKVKFSDLAFAKGGRGQRSLVLTISGGKIGDEETFTIGYPKFELSKRYVILAKEDLGSRQNGYGPIVYFNQGFFPVDVQDGRRTVRDWNGRPVSRYQDGHLVVRESPNKAVKGSRRGAVQQGTRTDNGMTVEGEMNGQIAAEVMPEGTATAAMTEGEFLDLIREIDAGER